MPILSENRIKEQGAFASGGQEPFLRKKVPGPPKTFYNFIIYNCICQEIMAL
jgi:hypothetical protein